MSISRIERLNPTDVGGVEPSVSERSKKRKLWSRRERVSAEPSSRQLVSRAHEDALFIEAMPSRLRGMLSVFAVGLVWVSTIGAGALWMLFGWFAKDFVTGSAWDIAFDVGLSVFLLLLTLISSVAGIRALRIDLRAPKQNPIVFNRRTRKVYRFTPDVPGLHLLAGADGKFSFVGLLKYIGMTFLPWRGMILVEYDWNCIEAEYYTRTVPVGNVIRTESTLDLFVRASPDSDEVIGSFPLALAFDVGSEASARALWEHVRRFMEERGPALSPGDEPAPPPPRGFIDAAVGMFGKKWAAIWFLGALWTLPETFFFAYALIGRYFGEGEFWMKVQLFPRLGSDLVQWWMLYPWWSQRAMGLFWVLKLLISFPCNVFTAMMFFGGLSAYLSPKAQLPEDLLADAGRVVDLRHSSG